MNNKPIKSAWESSKFLRDRVNQCIASQKISRAISPQGTLRKEDHREREQVLLVRKPSAIQVNSIFPVTSNFGEPRQLRNKEKLRANSIHAQS